MTNIDNVGSRLTNTITTSRSPLEITDEKHRSTNTVGSPPTTAACFGRHDQAVIYHD